MTRQLDFFRQPAPLEETSTRKLGPIFGLTLWQPWAWAIAAGHKRVENRRWQPASSVRRVRPWIAIHAGQTVDPEGTRFLTERGVPLPRTLERGAILCVARLAGVVTASTDPMFFGPYGWMLEDLRSFDPIPCGGHQGLWPLSPDIAGIVQQRATKERP